MKTKRTRIITKKPVDIVKVIELEKKRAVLYGQSVREIMESEGISWKEAKAKLQRELKFLSFKRRMSNLNLN